MRPLARLFEVSDFGTSAVMPASAYSQNLIAIEIAAIRQGREGRFWVAPIASRAFYAIGASWVRSLPTLVDELLRSMEAANNRVINIENLDDGQLGEFRPRLPQDKGREERLAEPEST